MLHVMSLTKLAAAHARSWAANSPNARIRLRAENERLQQEVALPRAEIRIKDARMKALTPHHRPFYPPPERLEILELRAARGWSLQQTAEAFLVCSKTIASWMTRLEESGSRTLVQLGVPIMAPLSVCCVCEPRRLTSPKSVTFDGPRKRTEKEREKEKGKRKGKEKGSRKGVARKEEKRGRESFNEKTPDPFPSLRHWLRLRQAWSLTPSTAPLPALPELTTQTVP
jgi:hypothetical protein